VLNALMFVKGAVSTKDFVPSLTHFRIASGRVTGFNGKMSLSAPIALDVDCCPKAEAFVKAVEACGETAQLHLTPTGRLAIRSGKFRANIETLNSAEYPNVEPEGITIPIEGGLMEPLTVLYEFSAEDASRPWAAGVLLDGQSGYATNNVCILQFWLGYHFPYRVTIPRYAVKEMMRVGEDPVAVQLTATSLTFHYADNRWLRTQLVAQDWPDISGLFEQMPADAPTVPKGLFEALDKLTPFADDQNHVYFLPGSVATTSDGAEGASVDVPGLAVDGVYNLKMLKLLALATKIGFASYPDKVPFYGPRLRGFIAGMRK
jgi:DNA polymerase III sliding clamp (beta) subunit (PCNA family)